MARRSNKHQQSDAALEEAMRIARGRQRPGQTKQQTKLIAQGIRKGIEHYRKQESARARELDRKRKKVNRQPGSSVVPDDTIEVREIVVYRQHWLPWTLLTISWLGMATWWFAG